MSGFDANNVYTVAVHDTPAPVAPDAPSETEKLFLDFLLQYRVGGEFIYRRANFLFFSPYFVIDPQR
jgi:DNA replication licensing factor MCM5